MSEQDALLKTLSAEHSPSTADGAADEGLAKNRFPSAELCSCQSRRWDQALGPHSVTAGAPFAGGAFPLSVLCPDRQFVRRRRDRTTRQAHGKCRRDYLLHRAVDSSRHRFVTAWVYPLVYVLCQPYFALVFGNLIASAIVPSAAGSEYTIIWWRRAGLIGLRPTQRRVAHRSQRRDRSRVVRDPVLRRPRGHKIIDAGGSNTASVFTPHFANAPGFHGLSG